MKKKMLKQMLNPLAVLLISPPDRMLVHTFTENDVSRELRLYNTLFAKNFGRF